MNKYSISIMTLALSSQIMAQSIPENTSAKFRQINISKEIPFDQEVLLKKDIQNLAGFNFELAPEAATKIVLGLNIINGRTVSEWLKERVSTIVGEKFNLNTRLDISRNKVIYPNLSFKAFSSLVNLDILPPELNFNDEHAKSEMLTVMSNLGAGLYASGKENRVLFELDLSHTSERNKNIVPILSPRIGIIQIGEGHFHPNLSINPADKNAYSNSINRISTLLHEARHSDGNGKSLAFSHVRCPAELKEYAGAYACDRNLNGPYSVGFVMTLEMVKNCKDKCTTKESQILMLQALDSASRIVNELDGSRSKPWDSKPEVAELAKK